MAQNRLNADSSLSLASELKLAVMVPEPKGAGIAVAEARVTIVLPVDDMLADARVSMVGLDLGSALEFGADNAALEEDWTGVMCTDELDG